MDFLTLLQRKLLHNFKGAKLSKSHGTFIEVPYFLSRYDPDPLCFYLTATAPETGDTEACPEARDGFSWTLTP